jgi:hypothetical protein
MLTIDTITIEQIFRVRFIAVTEADADLIYACDVSLGAVRPRGAGVLSSRPACRGLCARRLKVRQGECSHWGHGPYVMGRCAHCGAE